MEKTLEQAEREFQEWLKTIQVPEEKYYVSFDDRGQLLELSPTFSQGKVEIDKEIALSIYEGTSTLKSFKVNTETLEIEKNNDLIYNNLTRIDDILHRVIEKKWSKVEKPDISIFYHRKQSDMTFKINPLLKTVDWLGDRELVFLLTDYNDPNVLYAKTKFSVDEIISYPQIFKIDLPEKFSVYTRRIFNRYTLEIK